MTSYRAEGHLPEDIYRMTSEAMDSYAPGQLVWVALTNSLENRRAKGKWRPAVLIGRDGAQWVVMGLTTNPTYRNGQARVAIPNPTGVGLRGPGYLWGSRTARICVLDLGGHIGWADHELVDVIVSIAHLPTEDALAIKEAATTHHGARAAPEPPAAV